MAQAALTKSIKEPDEAPKIEAKPVAPPLIGTVIASLAGVLGTAILALGLGYAAHIAASHAGPPPAAAPYILTAAGSEGIVWRLNTTTGEMIACRSLGPAGIVPNDLAGAGCWQVRTVKTASP